MRVHSDHRRVAYCDLFEGTPGDVNLFVVEPGQRTCWHRHQRQHDYFRCIHGVIRLGYFPSGWTPRYQLLNDPEQHSIIYPNVWHGYENIGDERAYVLMYLDRKYDPTDEERMSEAEMPWNPVTVEQTLRYIMGPLVDDEWNKGQDPPDETTT